MKEVLQKFKEDFEEIRKKGFVESHRIHNTGIGKTFEDLVNVKENNKQEVDYLEKLELKSSRELSGSMVTLFTKSPSYPPKANTQLRLKFGKDENGLKILHTTISGNKFNTFLGRYGFKLEIDEKEKRIYILVKDLKSETSLNFDCYYAFEDIKKIVEGKCRNIAFITAKHKEENGQEFFHFEKAILLTGLTFNKFLEGIKNGDILYDIRIGVYKRGKNMGKTHDHGSGFRIKKNQIKNVFNITLI
ncbi:MAG: MvaI/BcnI restriction endonuclease family protein [Nanoarchaeota archaeon]|nr:MvaI/BcnI restriction endonuclease family protein [Nanoarchaeota archaeon]